MPYNGTLKKIFLAEAANPEALLRQQDIQEA